MRTHEHLLKLVLGRKNNFLSTCAIMILTAFFFSILYMFFFFSFYLSPFYMY